MVRLTRFVDAPYIPRRRSVAARFKKSDSEHYAVEIEASILPATIAGLIDGLIKYSSTFELGDAPPFQPIQVATVSYALNGKGDVALVLKTDQGATFPFLITQAQLADLRDLGTEAHDMNKNILAPN